MHNDAYQPRHSQPKVAMNITRCRRLFYSKLCKMQMIWQQIRTLVFEILFIYKLCLREGRKSMEDDVHFTNNNHLKNNMHITWFISFIFITQLEITRDAVCSYCALLAGVKNTG